MIDGPESPEPQTGGDADGRPLNEKDHRAIQRDAWVGRVEAFVVRARRVEQHSLASNKIELLKLAQSPINIEVEKSSGTMWAIEHLPPEEQVESAAARVRPFLLKQENIYHGKVMKALRGLLKDSADATLMTAVESIRKQWMQFDSSSTQIRGYGMQIQDTDTNITHAPKADNELAFAWIYGDTVHADTERLANTHSYGIKNRYRAAVPLVANLFFLSIATLNLIRSAVADNLLGLDNVVFSQEVVVTQTHSRMPMQLFVADTNADADYPLLDQPLDSSWTPVVVGQHESMNECPPATSDTGS